MKGDHKIALFFQLSHVFRGLLQTEALYCVLQLAC